MQSFKSAFNREKDQANEQFLQKQGTMNSRNGKQNGFSS